MTVTAAAPLKPLDEALADLDTPEAVSDRKHRALEWAKRLEGLERQQIINMAPREQLWACSSPFAMLGIGTCRLAPATMRRVSCPRQRGWPAATWTPSSSASARSC